MRKTKCKQCDEHGEVKYLGGHMDACNICKGTKEISVYTIQELREGEVAIFNNDRDALIKVLRYAFPYDTHEIVGTINFYWSSSEVNNWTWSAKNPGLPTQSVKIFLEEIEQEEKASTTYSNELIDRISARNKEIINALKDNKVEEPEFKWGEDGDTFDAPDNFEYREVGPQPEPPKIRLIPKHDATPDQWYEFVRNSLKSKFNISRKP